MNKWLFAVFFLFASFSGFSQVSIGAQAGGVLSNPTNSYTFSSQTFKSESKFGWQAGLLFDIPFGEDGWRLMPELKYVTKGFDVNVNTTIQLGQPVPVVVVGSSTISYLELPVNLAYTVELGDNNLVIGAGPYAAYGLSYKDDIKPTVNGQAVPIPEVEFGTEPGTVKRFDYGANLSVGYLLSGGLMFKANYNLGLANISNEGNGSSYKNNYFGLSIVYFFKRAGE